jgi:flagellar protein FlgJ
VIAMADIKGLSGLDSYGSLELSRLNAQTEKATALGKSTMSKGAAHEKEIEKAGTQFEALLVHEMLKSMWASVPKDGMLSGSHEEELYQDMFQEQMATTIAEHQSIGVKDVVISDIKRTEARKK